MDAPPKFWYFSDMTLDPIPVWQLYGEKTAFPDVLHVERIIDRAAGLHWAIAAHRHLHLHQIFLLISGQIQMTLDGAVHHIQPPAVVNVPRGTVHGFSFSAGTEGFVVTLPTDHFPDLFDPASECAAPLARSFILPADLSPAFAAIAQTHAENLPYRRTHLRAQAAALFVAILQNDQGAQARRRNDPRIARFEDLVRQSLQTPRSVQDFAADLALSPRHLSRMCRAETGLSAQAYIEAQKMREACRLLAYTRMTASQVAYHLGYDDPSYFSRVFQRNLNLSPRAYRDRFEA